MFRKLCLVMVLLTVSACIKIRDPKKEVSKDQKSPSVVMGISYEIIPLPQPQKYRVRFKGEGIESASIQRRLPDSNIKSMVVEGDEDVTDQAGIYEYRIQVGGREDKLWVEIPQDLVIKGHQNIKDLPLVDSDRELEFEKKLLISGRLYFVAGSVLTTQGLKVLIEADHIESEGARIQTFPENNYSPRYDGSGGGLVHLKSRSLYGGLHIIMRGLDGGNGGVEKFRGDARRDGYNGGNSGLLIVEIENLAKGFITYDLLPGRGADGLKKEGKPPGIPGVPGIQHPPCYLVKDRCEELRPYN